MQNKHVDLPVAPEAQDADESEGSSGLKVRTNLKAGLSISISPTLISSSPSILNAGSDSSLGLIVPRRGGGGTWG